MAQFVFDIASHDDGVGNLFAQQCLVTLTKPLQVFFDRVLGHAEFDRDLSLRGTVRFVHEHFFI
ncbi:MAG: hypothetical protein DMF08_04470 [Verrucomicrobia bacterium]|nr:MAG: hypothetical protein DMF08_04470 [Verrucomicrobiota bacterium]